MSVNKSDIKKKKGTKLVGKMQIAILLRTLVPMLIMGIVIAISATSIYEKSLKRETGDSLYVAASTAKVAYDEAFPGDYALIGEKYLSLYKGEEDITTKYSIIDSIKRETGTDISILYGNTRILTTLTDAYSMRYVGSGVNAAITHEMETPENKKGVLHEVDINGTMFLAYYMPIYDSNDEFVGIVAAATPSKTISEQALAVVGPIWIITIICMLIATIISFSYTNKLTHAIKSIGHFMEKMIGGELSNDMPSEVIRRNDELAHTARAILEMQNTIRALVERDPLTSLYNRRYGGAKMKKVIKNSEKSGVPFSFVMGDIDFFKKVNDTYGHEAGDIVLKRVSEILKKSMAGKGFVSRWGGEEFLIVYSKVNAAEAAKDIERTLETIRKMEILYDGLMIKVTMTFGVIDGSASSDYAELLREADSRLYYGKMNGRNRVICEDESGLVKSEAQNDVAATSNENANKKPEEAENQKVNEEIDKVNNPNSESDEDENVIKEVKVEKLEVPRIPTASETPNSLYKIDDELLEEIIQKMTDKLYSEAMEDVD